MGLFLTSSAPKFCPLHEQSSHPLPAAGDWLEICLETKLFLTSRQSGILGRQDAGRIWFIEAAALKKEADEF